jgi:hypothetical protein
MRNSNSNSNKPSTNNGEITDNNPPSGGNALTFWLGSRLLKLSAWKIEGELPKQPKFVIAVGPHTSNWDFFLGVAVLFTLRIRIRFLGKHTIFKPVLKQLLEAIGGIPVKRSSKHGVVDTICKTFDANKKMILALSPEGTRSVIFPWKTGFLAIAQKAQVPVQLIGFDFKTKTVKIGPLIHPSENINDDMQVVYHYFSTITAKYPQNAQFSASK